jgi:hypothetical protein
VREKVREKEREWVSERKLRHQSTGKRLKPWKTWLFLADFLIIFFAKFEMRRRESWLSPPLNGDIEIFTATSVS